MIGVDARGNPFGVADRTEQHTEHLSVKVCHQTTRLEIVHLSTASPLIKQAIDRLIESGGTLVEFSLPGFPGPLA